MNKPSDFDVGPLTWVKGEIDQALERSLTALKAYTANPAETTQLKFCRTHFHQAHGALEIVGLDGVTRLSEEVESLLMDMGEAEAPQPATLTVAEQAYKAIRVYLEELLAGEPNQPLKLYEVYQAVAGVRGRTADPIDLYYPDLSRRPPRREQPAVAISAGDAPRFYRQQRTRYQRGLLRWLRDDAAGVEAMRVAVAAVEAVQTSPAQRAFWWVALGFFDGLAAGALAEESPARRLCNRIEQQLKRLVEGSTTVAERLMREVLFAVARASPVSEHIRQVQQVYALSATLPESLGLGADEAAQDPALRTLRETVAVAKNTWNKCASGHHASLSSFVEQCATLQRQAGELVQPSLEALTAQLHTVAQWLEGRADGLDDIVAMEVATGLLLVENGVDNYARLSTEFDAQAELMVGRLQACMDGTVLSSAAPVPVLDEMSRRAQERLLMSQVVTEIQASLRSIEQTLDEFFRDSTRRAALPDLARPVRQVLGAFTMLGEDQAATVLSECFADIQRFAQPGYEPSQTDFERVAGALSGLGFYVEALQHGKAELERFMQPIGAARKQAGTDESTPETTVEEEIAHARRSLEKQFEAWRRQPEDVQLKLELQARLTAMQKDANLVADSALERRIGEVLALLRDADAQPFNAEISQVMQNIAPGAAVAAPSPEAAKLLAASDEIVDAELLAIYLEEAGEVLTTIAEHLEMARQQPHDMEVLRTIRRGYHTLKGSGRMVGLVRLGEAAWAIEQVMNRWLEEERAASADLLQLVEAGRAFFADAVAALKADGSSPDESAVVALADKVKRGEPLSDGDWSAAPAAAVVADEPVAETAAATEPAVDQPAEPVTDEPVVAPAAPVLQQSDATETMAPIEASGDANDPAALDFSQLFEPIDEPAPRTTAGGVIIGGVELSRSLFDTFIREARDILGSLRQAHASPLPGSFNDDFRRSLHTLTGISGTARFSAIVHVSEALERVLAGLTGEPDAEVRAAIGEALMTLDAMVRAAADERLPEPAPDLVARLYQLSRPLPTEAADSEQDRQEVDEELAHSLTGFDGEASPAQDAPNIATEAEEELDFSMLAPESQGESTTEAPGEATSPSVSLVEAPADPLPAASSADTDDDLYQDGLIRIQDDLDPQLLPIFLEEAEELMPAIGSGLRDWRDTQSSAAGHALQRVLHTLKGSARMAGAMAIGEVTHVLETRVENALAMQTPPPTLFDELESGYDRLSVLYERLLNPEAEPEPSPAAAEPAAAEDKPAAAAAVVTPPITPEEQEVVAQQRALLRVRAEVIDRLVNEAGEVSIARSRIEGEMRALKTAVGDLTENVSRLRAQLREIEIQAESQMQSKMSLAQEQHEQFDPLEFDRFTRFQELTRMMAESVNDVSTVHQQLLSSLDEADAALLAQARMTRELQGGLMRIRMVPFASISERLYRVVRQAAKDAAKRAVLDVRGSQVELDRSMLERITAPFEHMLRNSVAHGVEPVEERLAQGKPQVGEIQVEVRQEGNEIVLQVSDDGAGLDLSRIRARAEQQGLLEAGAEIDDAELAQFIFHPGFSTAGEVTQLAGRGVGMDVVKSEISALGGRVDVHSEAGVGTRFTIALPLTTAVTQAVLVRAGGRLYAVPSVMVEQVRQFKADELGRVHEAGELQWQGRSFALRYLPRLLGDAVYQPEPQRLTPVLLARSGASLAAVQVDEIIGNQEIVVKNTGPLLARVIGITGATVLGTGEIVLILNPVVLAQNERPLEAPAAVPGGEADGPTAPTVMIVDDSLTVRKITGRLLTREGYNVLTAKDGVDAMEQLQEAQPDVMLVDIEMPRMDGFDLTRNVRADGRLKHIPIIMITSRTAEKHRKYAAEVGVNVYLGKPYQEDQLLEHISAFVEHSVPA